MKRIVFIFDNEDAAANFWNFIGKRGYFACYGGFYNAIVI